MKTKKQSYIGNFRRKLVKVTVEVNEKGKVVKGKISTIPLPNKVSGISTDSQKS